jgi:hypothetical protein
MMFRAVFWVILPRKMIVDRQYAPLKRRSTIILHGSITQKTALNEMTSLFTKLQLSFLLKPELYLMFLLNIFRPIGC